MNDDFKTWIESEEGKECNVEGHIVQPYLYNRLWRAFHAGLDCGARHKWISVKDRLPAVGETVIIPGGCAFYNGEDWSTVMYEVRPIEWTVTHWMPRPEPPKQ